MDKKIRALLFWLFAAAVLPFVFTQPLPASGETPETPDKPATIEELKEQISGLLKEHQIPGVGIALVSKDNIIWTGGVGVANRETGEPVTENTQFRLSGITMSIVGLGFLKLAEEGKVELETPIEELVPGVEFENPWEETDPVRLVHLLEHTSGFDETRLYQFDNRDHPPDIPLRDVVAMHYKSRVSMWKPGTREGYTSHGYLLAGYIMEKITDMRFEEYLRRSILEPTGMSKSWFDAEDRDKYWLARGYMDNRQAYDYVPSYTRPADSFISSAADMALLIKFMLNRGTADNANVFGDKILSEASIQRMETPSASTAAQKGLKIGNGIGLRINYRSGMLWYGHSGSMEGFSAIYAYNPRLGLGCALLFNSRRQHIFYKIVNLVMDYLVGDKKPLPKPGIEIPAAKLETYTGYYDLANPHPQLTAYIANLMGGVFIERVNNTLYLREAMEKKKEALIPVSENMFRRKYEPDASVIFTTDETGKAIMVDGDDYYEKADSGMHDLYRTLYVLLFLIMFSSIVYAVFWGPVHLVKKLMDKENRSKYLRMRVMPLLAVLSISIGYWTLFSEPPERLFLSNYVTIGTVTYFIASLLFFAFSILSVVYAIKSFSKPVKMIARIYALLVSGSCLITMLYLLYWGQIGFMWWSY
jgi:CubicO group peptidase (beta-lactamase class C family)